jgi:hypothetical protein
MKGDDIMEAEPNEEELIRQAMRVIGSRKTPRKTESSRANVARATEARTGQTLSEEHRAKLKAAQMARRERERVAQQALGAEAVPTEPRRRGRPTKPIDPDQASAPKRGRGRPRKQDAQTSAQSG